MSQFIEMFGGCLNKVEITSLCDVFIDGDWIESRDQSDIGIRLIQTGNVGNGFFKDKDDKSRFINEETFTRLNCTEIMAGDVLVSRLPEPIGRACIIPNSIGKAITAVDCTIMRFKDTLLPEFFIAYTQTPDYQLQINKVSTGTTRRRVSRMNLGKIRIICPSIDEQKQFVEIAQQADKSKFIGFKSQFIEMFENYPRSTKLGDVFILMRNGANIKQGQILGGIPITRIETISEGVVDRGKLGYAGIFDDKYRLFYLEDNDILVSHINSIKHIGKCALYKKVQTETIIHGMNLLCLRHSPGMINPIYALYLLRSEDMRKSIVDITKPAVNQASFTVKDLAGILIKLPPINEQNKFSTIAQQADKSKYIN